MWSTPWHLKVDSVLQQLKGMVDNPPYFSFRSPSMHLVVYQKTWSPSQGLGVSCPRSTYFSIEINSNSRWYCSSFLGFLYFSFCLSTCMHGKNPRVQPRLISTIMTLSLFPPRRLVATHHAQFEEECQDFFIFDILDVKKGKRKSQGC